MATLSAASSLSSYLNNVKADPRLLGVTTLLNPMPDHVSAQRGKMFSDHISQWQVLKGCEFPYVFTGYEKQIGSYEVSTTDRDTDVTIVRNILKFNVDNGVNPLTYYPTTTVIYQTVDANNEVKFGYFNINNFTARSDGYGYPNVKINYSNIDQNTFIPKEEKLVTSPCHKGNKYCYGTNLRVAYMSLPHVTEDAFLISRTAANKCGTTGIEQVTINIKIDQIPVNLYGNEEGEYKFFPDVGEYVNDDGIICALRRPTAESFIYDTAAENLSIVQPLHDAVYYAPRGAKIVDVDVVINSAVYQSQAIFAQCEKYRDQLDKYYRQIYDTYQDIKHHFGAKALTFDFNGLIAAAYNRLRVDNQPLEDVPGGGRRKVKPRIKKEVVEYISLTITYMYDRELQCGYKIAGRYGNKGVVSIVMPDEMMPVDENGLRADIVVDPISVFNRMNPAQWYEQFFNRGSELIIQRVKDIITTTHDYQQAYDLIVSYCTDINENYGNKIRHMTDTPEKQREFIDDCLNDGIYLNIVPFQKGIDQNKVMELIKKYNIYKSNVTFGVYDENGEVKWVTTKKPVMIGYEYWMMLYKMPHAHGSGISHVNQYRTPVKGSKTAMEQYPINQTPFRLGEDEVRNLVMVAGANTAAKILCEYANSPEAVNDLAGHLLNDDKPGTLKRIDNMTVDEMIKSNGIVGVAKHIFSTFGVDISPEDEE